MKKRILSILLAAMMIVPIICAMPITVSAEVSNNYSYKFEEVDARNYVEGQVVDLGYAGEAVTAPAMDGSLTNYQASQRFVPSDASKGVPYDVYYATKDGYFYVAIDTDDASELGSQFAFGVSQWASSDGSLSRLAFNTYLDENSGAPKATELGRFFKYPQSGVEGTKYADKGAAWANDSSNLNYADNRPARVASFDFVKTFNGGVYEAKINISRLYEYFGVTVRGEDIWETPCMTFFFFHDLGGGKECSYYIARGVSHKIDYADSTTALPGTIILPAKTMATIKKRANTVGTFGADYRNAYVNQLTVVDKYSSDIKFDGLFTEDDHYEETTISNGTLGDFTLKVSVGEDGFIYVGTKFKAPETADLHFGVGLVNNSSRLMTSRTQVLISPSGGVSYSNLLIGDAIGAKNDLQAGTDGTLSTYFGMTKSKFNENKGYHQSMLPVTKAARTYADGYVTVETKIAIAPLVAIYDTLGWDIIASNCIHLEVTDGTNFYTVNKTGGNTTNLWTSFHHETSAYAYPTIQLPIGCTERFKVDSLYDLEAYGQKHINAVKNTVTLDGVISEGEYGSGVNTTASVLADQGVDITEYFSGDDNYFYIAAKVIDPNFAEGITTYQWDIPVPARADGKVDNSDTIRRVNAYLYPKKDGTVKTNKPDTIWRTQEYTSSGNAGEKAAKNIINTITNSGAKVENFYKAAITYDEATNATIYEIAVSKAALRQVFGLAEDYAFDTFAYFSYYATGNNGKNKAAYAEFTNTYLNGDNVATARLAVLLRALAIEDLGFDNIKYTSCSPANVVVNLVDDIATNNSASVRISTENSGLRFKTVYSNDYLEEMKAYAESKGETMQIGTLIAPNDYVNSTYEFSHAALGEGNYVEVFGSIETPYSSGSGTTTIAGSIVNIKEGNLGRHFAGIGFVKVGDEYFYSDVYTVKCVSTVAFNALNDTKTSQMAGYNYEVSAGVWSPYTDTQRQVLSDLIAK